MPPPPMAHYDSLPSQLISELKRRELEWHNAPEDERPWALERFLNALEMFRYLHLLGNPLNSQPYGDPVSVARSH
jgi:hypothetical protein